MCGISFAFPKSKKFSLKDFFNVWEKSTTRGSDSSGIAISFVNIEKSSREILVFKCNSSPKAIIKNKKFHQLIKDKQQALKVEYIFAHTRMNTDGNSYTTSNNQPLISGENLLVFNGIVTNAADVLSNNQLNDGFALFENSYSDQKNRLKFKPTGVQNTIQFDSVKNQIKISSNNENLFLQDDVNQLLVVSEPNFLPTSDSILTVTEKVIQLENATSEIKIIEIENFQKPVVVGEVDFQFTDEKFLSFFHTEVKEKFKNLRRCVNCILPETHPFIEFDDKGVCNFCKNNKEVILLQKATLNKKLNKNPQSLLGLSGGRDSCFALHKLVTEYNHKPITYTYDWGVNTNLARRNISRMCGKLGIENILVAADIRTKRKNVKLNLLAWLERPHLGVLPLLMAGDKQFISNAAKIKKLRGIELEFFAFNLHEKTQFKEELTGIRMWDKNASTKFGEDLSVFKQLWLLYFYGKETLFNPKLINSSIFDSLRGFFNYYHSNVDIIQFFSYEPWDEAELNMTLKQEYDWEFSEDTITSWRIGDGTAAFYNIAYYLQLGFTENDVIRSNLIRNKKLKRSDALELIAKENDPRLPTLKWYCDILGVDIKFVLEKLTASFYKGFNYV